MLVWDLLVRLFHWCSAAIIIVNYWFAEAGEAWHTYFGYALMALLAARCVWGFVGTATARFNDFWPTPERLRDYLQQRRLGRYPYRGHSPVAGLMVLLLMVLMALVSLSGWLQTLDYFWGEPWPQLLHEYAAHGLMVAAGIHIVAVFYLQRQYRVALVKPMFTGKRKC